jgi:hypothetical protein
MMINDEISGTIFGKPFSVKGRDILPWALVGVLVAACGYLVDFAITKWGTPIDLSQTIVRMQNQSAEQHEKIRSSMESRLDELTYVLSITQEERARLRLDMPDTLRQRVHKGEHP